MNQKQFLSLDKSLDFLISDLEFLQKKGNFISQLRLWNEIGINTEKK